MFVDSGFEALSCDLDRVMDERFLFGLDWTGRCNMLDISSGSRHFWPS
jgi:hypothetical protein